jgi:hypothetical protein
MNRILGLLAAALLIAGTAGPVSAGTAAFGGTLTLSLADLGNARYQATGVATVNGGPNIVLPPPPGSIGTVGAHMTKIEIAQSVWTGTQAFPVTDPVGIAANGITEVRFTLTNAAGSLAWTDPSTSPGGPLTSNTLGLVGGLARLCLVFGGPGCVLNLPLALGQTGHTAGSNAATGLGIGGQQLISGGPIAISIDHAPWTAGTASALSHKDAGGTTDCVVGALTTECVISTRKGTRHGPASASSSVNLGTVSSPAVVQFVTPGQVTTNITATTSTKLQLINTMRFKMVPEPGLVLLLGTGVAGLAILGRRRMRR